MVHAFTAKVMQLHDAYLVMETAEGMLVIDQHALHERVLFEQLIERSPDNLKLRTTATEAMLSLRRGDLALAFGEEGLKAARRLHSRDTEQHLLELVAAARKQG